MGIRSVLIGILTAVVCIGEARPARADRLCDPAGEDCRAILLNLIKNERVGIDVAFWFMEDARYSAEIIRSAQAGVPVRVIFDPSANAGHPVNAQIVEQLRALGLHPSSLPLGIRDGCVMCRTCNSFACKLHAKSEADVCCVRPALRHDNVRLWRHTKARRLLTDAGGRRVTGVELEREDGVVTVEAPVVVVACGAVNSAALLLRSATDRHPDGLANSSGLVGRRYMAHLATMMQGFHPGRPNPTDFQKTVAINDFYLKGPRTAYPLGQIQSQGRTHAIMAKVVGDTWRYKFIEWRHIPQWAYAAWMTRAIDWLAMTEDLPRVDNRVTLDGNGDIRLVYQPNNLRAHDQLVTEAKRMLRKLGFWMVMTHSHKSKNTTHQCGTLVFGTDPRESVLDTYCRAHDVENLFVVDASFFPSSAAVNPGLTIVAQALRAADHIRSTDL